MKNGEDRGTRVTFRVFCKIAEDRGDRLVMEKKRTGRRAEGEKKEEGCCGGR